jgi:O-antigen/teichoic acid export membrane protein
LTLVRPTTTNRETMRHATIYSSAAMLGRLVGFIMLPFYAHMLRGDGYAVIGMIDVGISLLVSLLGYGLSGAIILHYHEEKDPARKPRVVSTGIVIATAASFGLVLLPMLFARPVSSLLLNDANLSRLLVMALVGFGFEMAGQAASSWLLIRSRSVVFASVNLFRLIIGLSLNILLIVVLNWGLDGYFVSSLITALLTNTIFVLLAVRDCGWSFDRQVAESMRKFMLPLIPGNVVSFVSRQIERVLVKFQVDLAAVGILEMGYKFPILIAQLVTTPFMQSWGTRRFEMADQPEAPAQIGRMFTFFLFLVCYVGLVMAVTIKPILVILTPPEFHLSYRIAQLEILTLILQGCEGHLNFGLFYAKHTGVITKLRTVTAVMKIGLAYVFVSVWSIYGAAFSAAIMAVVTLVVAFRLSQKRYHLELEWFKVSVLSGVAIAAFVVVRLWDVARLPGFSFITDGFTPWVAHILQGTFFGHWRDGILIKTLQEDRKEVAEILINGSVALAYGLLLPWVRDRALLPPGSLVHRLALAWPERLRRAP